MPKPGTPLSAQYVSTRGLSPVASFCDILLGGLAPDGGLYMPKVYPTVTRQMLDEWRDMQYPELAFSILRLYCDDIPEADLWELCHKSYTPANFAYKMRPSDQWKSQPTGEITPYYCIGQHADGSQSSKLGILELSNGPTLAFKDMAMQLLGNLFEYELARRGAKINILGATSGDTGSAAEYALLGKKGVRVFMLSPAGKMSAFQRAQMYSLMAPNIFNIAIDGMFDDGQRVVKEVSGDPDFKTRFNIGAVNSINWARIVAQVVYYFAGYFSATESSDEMVTFAVPSGNFGNVCAGHIARMMGLPIGRLVLATNENNVLDEFFRTGIYRPRNKVETHVTSSPSMDIASASNFERFVFDMVGRNPIAVQELFGKQGKLDLVGQFNLSDGAAFWSEFDEPPPGRRFLADWNIVSGTSTHEDRIRTIRRAWEVHGILIDPHTADAFKVAHDLARPGENIVVLETAQPAKFGDTMMEAISREGCCPESLVGIEQLPQRVVNLPAEAGIIKQFIADACGHGI